MNLFSRICRKIKQNSKRKSFALNEIDIKLIPFVNFKRGFFVEAGANDGISQSNTLYFEKYKKWTGLLIEPIPKLFQKCKVNRPKCIIENAALVPFDFQGEYVEMRYSNLMSIVKGAMKTEQDELEHISKGCKIQNIETYDVKVPARTLNSILKKHSIRNIDLLSLDVEGFELNALKGIDFEYVKPKFLLVEARYRKDIDSFLYPLYEPIAELSHHDVLYKLG